VASDEDSNREELAHFLRSRRRRVTPASVGLATGPRRRSPGLLREEVAVLAGLSPTWYTYLEQGRKIRPSPEVLDSLARVLSLSEDERRYMHLLVHGQLSRPAPLNTPSTADQLTCQLVDLTEESPYPVYAVNQYCDLLAWNKAAAEWYEDWAELGPAEHNILHWMLVSSSARKCLVDWEDDVRDVVARWRTDTAKWNYDERVQRIVADLSLISPQFARWWADHEVQEHRSRVRRLRHPRFGIRTMRVLPVTSPEFPTAMTIFHLPVTQVSGD
jgi:transcriptional regulator with XRE-family HTH domain